MGVMGVVVNRAGISLCTSGSAGWGECMCNVCCGEQGGYLPGHFWFGWVGGVQV